jgi:hypothetical protein
MKSILLVAGIGLALAGCASSAHHTAWGKPGVSRVAYGTDIGMCTGLAAIQNTGNGANSAGGINGRNSSAQTDTARGSSSAGAAAAGAPAGGGSNVPATGTYSGMVSTDFAQRAATQQRALEMQAKKLQAETYKSCLTERGYKEFRLTAEQQAKLNTFKVGSNEYHEYLYSLGANADVVAKQGAN